MSGFLYAQYVKVTFGPRDRYCIGCGYGLEKTLGERCPECGRGFSACDAASWTSSPWRGRLLGVFTGPPRGVDFLLATAAAAVSLMAYAAPGRYTLLAWAGAELWLASAALWILRWSWWRYNKHRQVYLLEWPAFRQSMAVAPAILLLTVALIGLRVPLRLAFMVSRSGLERAITMQPGLLRVAGETNAGVYRVRPVGDSRSPIVRFIVVGDGLAPERQLINVPDDYFVRNGDPAVVERRYVQLSGNWYLQLRP